MNRSKVHVCDFQPADSNSAQTTINPSTTSWERFRRRKSTWIITFSVGAVLIILGLTIPPSFMKKNKDNTPEMITTTPTTSAKTSKNTTTTAATAAEDTITTTTTGKATSSINIHNDAKWKQNGLTIAGGNNHGNQLNQLTQPTGIYVDDDDRTYYIADTVNNRIMKWKFGANNGEVVAGGNGEGKRIDQFSYPRDVIVDKKNDSLIISDRGNKRVMRYSRRNKTNQQIIISNVNCYGLTMHHNGDLYVSDSERHQVRRWREGEINGTVVAGGNGKGDRLNQLDYPTHIFVDEDHSVYVSDSFNERVMKWKKDANEGIVVAGGHGEGSSLRQLSSPEGLIVDHLGNVYIADRLNHRIMRWLAGANEGSIVVGGNRQGNQPNQFYEPTGLSFDRQGNLFVVDDRNNRVQKFDIIVN